MKEFIEKYEGIFRGMAVFFLLFGDLHLITFTTSLVNSNPVGGVFMFVVGFVGNLYFYHLYTLGKR